MVRAYAVGGAVGVVAGLLIGWGLWRPTASVVDPPAPPLRQGDGSLVLERTAPTKEPPPHEIPKGGREERRVSVVVKPPRGVVVRTEPPESVHVPQDVDTKPLFSTRVDSCDCPPVQVDLSLVRMPDKTRRVVASSPTGEILSGVDIPFETAAAPRALPWAAGVTISADQQLGGFIDRDLGPFRFGIDFKIQRDPQPNFSVGLRF